MILSDKTLREELESGRIVIEPFDPDMVQPSSIDLHVDGYFRVFRNDTTPFIDPKEPQEDLTELVEVPDDGSFILHPGEFVLGSTLERVALPGDLVARLEGKSSLGRLGLLIHSSLPASEEILVETERGVDLVSIGELVGKRIPGRVVAFDPETFDVGYHEITGFYEGPEDRIYEVELSSGRRVRVTAGHNLFTLDRAGQLTKIRTGELVAGARVAVPRNVPGPNSDARSPIRVLDLVPEGMIGELSVEGPTVASVFEGAAGAVNSMLRASGHKHTDHYRRSSRLPLSLVRQVPGLEASLTPEDRLVVRGGRNSLPTVVRPTEEFAWLLGIYVAEGSRRHHQFTVSNTDQAILDRVEASLEELDLPISRSAGAITCCSSVASEFLTWIGAGGHAPEKRIPPLVFGWPAKLLAAFLEGLVDGDGSRDEARTSVWTTSEGLVGDVLLLAARLRRRAGSCIKQTSTLPLTQVYLPDPLVEEGAADELKRLTDGDLSWDTVVAVHDTGVSEPIYDLEVRPNGRRIENFLAGRGGVFVSNTAGFVDAGWDGHLTLELSNVANLPIAIYPGMKIGQISFIKMTTEADDPYGSTSKGSKYQGQRGPTPSRYYLNFDEK